MKICSLLPGATEVVAALGAADDLVGISHECDYPPSVRNKPVLVRPVIDSDRSSSPDIDRQVHAAASAGRNLYSLDAALFARTAPDLVITQDLCHVCAITPDQLQQAIGALPKPPRLLTLNPTSLDDILTDTERIGDAIGRGADGRALASELRSRLESIQSTVTQAGERPTVVCLEWLDPLYVGGHWVPEMVSRAGGKDLLGRPGARSEKVTWEQVLAAKPDILILMPCSFSAERTLREVTLVTSRPGWERLPAVKTGQVFAVDSSSFFSRPSPRLVEGVALLAALFHPALFGDTLPAGAQRVATGRQAM
jgi:iron complex transport system substrate-binding protein